MLIAFADTPAELLAEIVKLIKWREEGQRKDADSAATVRDRKAHNHAAVQLRLLLDDMARLHIAPVKERDAVVPVLLETMEVTSEITTYELVDDAGLSDVEAAKAYRAGWDNAVKTITGKALIAPTINLNGSSASRLVEEYCGAMGALRAAEERLCEIRPHGRDYQTAAKGDEKLAKDQHERRIIAVHRCYVEIEEIAQSVQQQER